MLQSVNNFGDPDFNRCASVGSPWELLSYIQSSSCRLGADNHGNNYVTLGFRVFYNSSPRESC
jgi:hypothetical protein